MITEYTKNDISKILYVINDAALSYKGIIPNFMKSVAAIAISYAVFEKSKAALTF